MRLAKDHDAFAAPLVPGEGNLRANKFTALLRKEASDLFGRDYSEFSLSDGQNARYDFYFPDEATVVEVAWGLPNPNTEFEKDILKALVGGEYGHSIKHLVLVSRPGAEKKCAQLGRTAVIDWALKHHDLKVSIVEVAGASRTRKRWENSTGT